jgi:RNA polymerase sigma-70 factor, ECF subfamily
VPAARTKLRHRKSVRFELLYRDYVTRVSRWVHRFGVPQADREDVVQDIFFVAFRRLAEFDGGKPAGWLYQITRRRVRDYRRLAWVKNWLGNAHLPLDVEQPDLRQGPLDEVVTKRRAQRLTSALATLNADQRAAFVLFEIEGRTGKQIAHLTGAGLNTVWQRLFKARQADTRVSEPAMP